MLYVVSATGTDTRQFYDLYNSAVDERDYLEKEVGCYGNDLLLEFENNILLIQCKVVASIHENYDA